MPDNNPLECNRPDCEQTDTKVYRIRLPGRNQDRKVTLCDPHAQPLLEIAEWSDDTPIHERRPERRHADRPATGRLVSEQKRIELLPLVEE